MWQDSELQSCQRFATSTELTREMLEVFVQSIRIDSNGALDITWNFRDYIDTGIPQ
jgi:site-specific DNA recombinase